MLACRARGARLPGVPGGRAPPSGARPSIGPFSLPARHGLAKGEAVNIAGNKPFAISKGKSASIAKVMPVAAP